MTYTVGSFIDGTLISGKPDYPITNPATGEVIGQLAFATEQEIAQAIEAARAAFPDWAATPALKRARVLFKFKSLLEAHIDELAALVTKEHGKVLADARGSVLRGIELVEFACGIPYLLRGSHSENVSQDLDCYTIRQALGVAVGVSPFNFPVMVPIWMFAQAIACGNTFILKPSEKAPSAVLYMAQLMTEAGLPPGVLNIVNGDKTVVESLITAPEVQTVTAVASTPVAEYIYKTAIAHGKRSHTFGGAKNHCVVMPDADLGDACNAIMGAAYGSAGERCMAIPVVVAVGDKVAEALVHELKRSVLELKIGPGTKTDVEMGPLISKEHLERVKSYIDIGLAEGAECVVDGRERTIAQSGNGFFMGACLFDRVTPDMRIYKEEIFGPVLSIVRVKDFNEALQVVNGHEYGNGTAIFTRDGDLARTFASKVQVGMVGINVPIPVPVAYHSFGGWKRSSFGDVAMHGDQSVQFYTKIKTITSRWPKGKYAETEYAMPTSH